jgi:hypothetical protein
MANTLTGLAEFIYQTVDNVSNEPAGLLDAVFINGAAEEAALNQDITYDVTAVGTARNTTPGATPPAFGDETTAAGTMKLTKSRSVPFYWSGDDEAKLGMSKQAIQNNKIAQAIRTLRNEMEADLAALHALTSRAYAAHATTPAALFGTNFGEAAQVRKILVDNGAPMADVSLVLGTTAGAAVRTLIGPTATQANVQDGNLVDMFGMALRESGQIVTTTAVGNNTGTYAINGAHAKGATTLTIKTGTGTILAGDVITIGTDTGTKYVVTTGVDNGTSIVIGAPGLKKALSGNESIAIVGVCERNMAFSRSAIHLLSRLPAQPAGGDSATDVLVVQDPITGIAFRFAQYKGYHANQYEVAACWGVKNVAPQHTALLLGN